jgi:hypothetical protein
LKVEYSLDNECPRSENVIIRERKSIKWKKEPDIYDKRKCDGKKERRKKKDLVEKWAIKEVGNQI